MRRPPPAPDDGSDAELLPANGADGPAVLDLSKIRVGHLDRLCDIRTEMAKVYRHVRTGKLPSQEGTRLVYMLDRLGRCIEGQELERRLAELEQFYLTGDKR